MTPENLHHLQALLVSRTGFLLAADRVHLAEHRLAPVARREGYSGVDPLMDAIRAQPPAGLAWSAMEAVLNPETWFRRDRTPFATFAREVLPAIAGVRPQGRVRVWSAGCSSGQEAYALAMSALESEANVEIEATDLSQRALEKARSGIYTQFEVQRGLSARQLLAWFEQSEDMWETRPRLRSAVKFSRANLLDEPPEGGRFDVIFCRYVLSDMAPERRARALDVLEQALADDGCLFLGLDETVGERPDSFRPVPGRLGVFVKAPAALRRAA
jgi:chemotaxis protein methyltransferase CheR